VGRPSAGGGVGRPRKPTALRILHGDQPRKGAENEPQPHGEIVVPEFLTAPARVFWDALTPDMIRTNTLTSWDVPIFAEFCEALVMARLARLRSMREVSGQIVVGPGQASATTAWLKAMTVVNVLSTRFGMTPGDRARLATSVNTGVLPGAGATGRDLLSS
jgi:phage terminase small subunit